MSSADPATAEPVAQRVVSRWARGADLDDDRVRSRMSAYVYGNVLALSSLASASLSSADTWTAVRIVLITMVTTYLAHVLAHDIGERVRRTSDQHAAHLRAELRDAVPIATSGLLPCAVLVLALLAGWSSTVGAVLATGLVVLRLGWTGGIVARLSREAASLLSWLGGIALALAGVVIAVLKVTLTH